VTHRLREEERAVLVVECEPSNPDVFKAQSEVRAVRDRGPSRGRRLDPAGLCDAHARSVVVVNIPARKDDAVTQ
jgi:hypothetical protein